MTKEKYLLPEFSQVVLGCWTLEDSKIFTHTNLNTESLIPYWPVVAALLCNGALTAALMTHQESATPTTKTQRRLTPTDAAAVLVALSDPRCQLLLESNAGISLMLGLFSSSVSQSSRKQSYMKQYLVYKCFHMNSQYEVFL